MNPSSFEKKKKKTLVLSTYFLSPVTQTHFRSLAATPDLSPVPLSDTGALYL